MTVEAHDGRVVIERSKPRYSLDELLAQCDESAPFPSELEGWV